MKTAPQECPAGWVTLVRTPSQVSLSLEPVSFAPNTLPSWKEVCPWREVCAHCKRLCAAPCFLDWWSLGMSPPPALGSPCRAGAQRAPCWLVESGSQRYGSEKDSRSCFSKFNVHTNTPRILLENRSQFRRPGGPGIPPFSELLGDVSAAAYLTTLSVGGLQ